MSYMYALYFYVYALYIYIYIMCMPYYALSFCLLNGVFRLLVAGVELCDHLSLPSLIFLLKQTDLTERPGLDPFFYWADPVLGGGSIEVGPSDTDTDSHAGPHRSPRTLVFALLKKRGEERSTRVCSVTVHRVRATLPTVTLQEFKQLWNKWENNKWYVSPICFRVAWTLRTLTPQTKVKYLMLELPVHWTCLPVFKPDRF